MKSKWLKAFKSLKTPPGGGGAAAPGPGNGPQGKVEAEKEKRNGKDLNLIQSDSAHQFQEYTYKKITPCDVCSQVLRGHTRQGLKCRLCKLNVHLDCQERVGKCQTKSRLLRRQKSSSEIETSRPSPNNEEQGYPRENQQQQAVEDATYRVLRTANEISASRGVRPPGVIPSSARAANPQSTASDPSSSRRRRLFGMRSFSVFGQHKSQDRAASLPETEQLQYAAGTRPFGQPLVLAGGASASGSPPQTPSPRTPKRNEE